MKNAGLLKPAGGFSRKKSAIVCNYKSMNKSIDRLKEHYQGLSLFKDSTIAFFLKISGSLLSFCLGVTIARLLGAEGAGLYFLAMAVMTVCSIVSRLGLDNALLKHIATRASQGDFSGVRSVYATGMRLGGVSAFILSFILFFLSPWISIAIFSKPELVEPLRWMSLATFGFSLLNLQAGSLKGLHRIRSAIFLQGVVMPLLVLLMIFPASQMAGVVGVSLTYVFATLIAAILGAWLWRKAADWKDGPVAPFSLSEIWPTSRPLWGVAILNGAVLPWLPLFLLGGWVSSQEVGIFGAALRMATLVSLFLFALNNVVAPKFAALYAKGDIDALSKVARYAAMLLAAIGSPVLILMIAANEWVMSLYGPAFAEGGRVLVILALGELVNVCCGPVGLLLAMTGNERSLRNGTLVASAFQALLCFILIPGFGMYGAAVAVSAGVVINNVIAVFFVRKYIGIAYPFKFGVDRV